MHHMVVNCELNVVSGEHVCQT